VKKVIWGILLIPCLVGTAAADQPREQQADSASKGRALVFTIHYAVVSNTLKFGDGCFDKLVDNVQVGDFWYKYAMNACSANTDRALDKELKSNPNPTQKETEEIANRLVANCLKPFIFDNWDKINSTIAKNPAKDCVKKVSSKK
jgi:hypothetical protein